MSDEAKEIAAIHHPSAIYAELEALRAIGIALDDLDVRAVRRALEWAQHRYKSAEPGMEAVMKFMDSVLAAIGTHQSATKQPRQIDRDLWESTIKGTKYWTEPKDEGTS